MSKRDSPCRLRPHERRRNELRCYVDDADRALIREAARHEGCSVSDYLRLAALHVALRIKRLRVLDADDALAAVLESIRPADA